MAKIRILKQNIEQNVEVIFTTKAIKQLGIFMSSTHAQTKEFLFLGYVDRKEKEFTIQEFFLVPQDKCSGAYCETDDERYPDWVAKNIPINKRKLLRVHGHSHVNMMTNPSGTDDIQLTRLIDEVDDYFIQLIINHNMNYKVNVWLKSENIVVEDPNLSIIINDKKLPLQSNLLKPVIADGNYRIKDNIINFNNNMKFHILENKFYTEDDNITYIFQKSTIKETLIPKITKEEKIDINNLMNIQIKQPISNCVQTNYYTDYLTKYQNQKKINSINLEDIEEDIDEYYGYGERYYGFK